MSFSNIQINKVLPSIGLALGGSLLVLAGLFYATSNAGHDINPSRLVELIKSSSIFYFGLYALTMILGLVLRAWRYLVLLKATGEPNTPNFKDMTLITAVRNMTVDLLPARLGELVFVGLLHKRSNTQISTGLTTLLYAMMLDILILAPVTIAIGLMVGFPNKQPYLLAIIAFAVAAAFIVGVKFILPLLSNLFVSLSNNKNRLLSSVFTFVVSVDKAVQSTMKAGVFTQVIGLTLLVRFLKYGGLLFLFYGLTQQSFPELAEMSQFKVLASMIASEITASLPIPALMSFGTWELGGMTLLAYFGAIPQNALLAMLGVHIQTQALDYAIGLVALVALFIFGRQVGAQYSANAKTRSRALAIFALAVISISWFSYSTLKTNKEAYSQRTETVARPSDSPVPAWLKEISGNIVWSSNRSGNHDIWIMQLPSLEIRQLTTDPHTENFAKLSPDGSKVVFARSHKEWQSSRDDRPWDVWMIDIASGVETRLAQWGVSPSWSPDGSFVVFQRDNGFVMAVDIESGKERIYYESGKDAFMKSRVNLNTPTIGKGERLAFTFRNHGQPTNVIRDELGEFQVVHRDSCQVQWSPSGDYVTYVQKGGKQINQIMRFDPKTKVKTTLLDLQGEYSHEYFAKLTHNEKYMVFAASSGGHEHDLADYELFLWPVGTDEHNATRLTFNAGNDSWPDIRLKE